MNDIKLFHYKKYEHITIKYKFGTKRKKTGQIITTRDKPLSPFVT